MYPALSLADTLLKKTRVTHPLHLLLTEAVRYQINNVAEYYYTNPALIDSRTKHPKGLLVADLAPNIAPLGWVSWFEWEILPTWPTTKEYIKAGCLVTTISDRKDPLTCDWLADYEPETRWMVDHLYFWWAESKGYKASPFSATVLINDDGHCSGALVNTLTEWGVEYDQEPDSTDLAVVLGYVTPSMIATCFAHCKGVKQDEVRPSRQVMRQAQREGRKAVTYKVLNIDPARAILTREGDVSHNGVSKALHICRGHFAHYTADAPLFGKHVGTYYIPMHTRGSLAKGRVVKDYNVLTPKGAT